MLDMSGINSTLLEATMNNVKLNDGISVAVASKVKDMAQQQGNAVIKLLDAAPVPKVDFKA